MPRPVLIALIWSGGIILATLALTFAGSIGVIPEGLSKNLAAGAVLALSWLATTLIVGQERKDGEA